MTLTSKDYFLTYQLESDRREFILGFVLPGIIEWNNGTADFCNNKNI